MPTLERRTAPRLPLDRACKLLRPDAGRYESARTINVSESGVLIEVRGARRIRHGERLALVIERDGRAVVSAGDFRPARVVRVETANAALADEAGPAGTAQRVAVEFLFTAPAVRRHADGPAPAPESEGPSPNAGLARAA